MSTAHASAPVNIADAPESVRSKESPDQFVLGPGDRISIRVWRHEDLNMDVTIAPDGSITYPLVGSVVIAGKTYPDIVTLLKNAISEYYEDPEVAVNIIELKNQKVYVLGEVLNPSVMQVTNELSIVEALTVAGGFNPTSRTKNVLLVRGGLEKPELYTIDVNRIFTEGDMTQMVYLQRGDIVVVPTKTITNVARYFKDVQSILAPVVGGSAIYRNAISGDAQGATTVVQ